MYTKEDDKTIITLSSGYGNFNQIIGNLLQRFRKNYTFYPNYCTLEDKVNKSNKVVKEFFNNQEVIGYKSSLEGEIIYGDETYYNDKKLKYGVNPDEIYKTIKNYFTIVLNISTVLKKRLESELKKKQCENVQFVSVYFDNIPDDLRNSLDDKTNSSNAEERQKNQNNNAKKGVYDITIDCKDLKKEDLLDPKEKFILNLIEEINKKKINIYTQNN